MFAAARRSASSLLTRGELFPRCPASVAFFTRCAGAASVALERTGDVTGDAACCFDVAGSAFVPPPKVTSSVVQLIPRAEPLACERRALERVTEAAFGQRRKMLRQSLKSLGGDPLRLLGAAGIEETARAEDIPVEGFVALARGLTAGLAA